MTVSVVDTGTAAPAAANLTFAASLVGATAGNALLWVIGGDKNSGTVTPPTDTPNLPFNLKGTGSPADQVTLALAYGTADGAETSLSGTVTANVAGGQVWVCELNDNVGTGAWARWGSVTNETNGTDVTSVALTGLVATETGLAVAAVAADSVNTQGTVAWTSSTGHTFTARRATASGGGQAGLWVATAPVVKGDTVSVTFSRTGGTADQHTGVMTVFARTIPSNDGVVAGKSPQATGALAATQTTAGVVAGKAPQAAGTLAATQTTAGEVAGSSPAARGTLAATQTTAAALAGTTAQARGALTGDVEETTDNLAEMVGSAPQARGALAAVVALTGAMAGKAPAAAGTLVGTRSDPEPPDFVLPLRAGPVEIAAGWSTADVSTARDWSAGVVTD